MASRCKTAILISGSGTNLQAFIDAVKDGDLDLELAVVFSNNPDAYGLERAEQAGIPTACIQHADFRTASHSIMLSLRSWIDSNRTC